MATIHEIRHANFLRLLQRFSTLQAFANAVDRSHSQMSQIKTQARHSKTGEPRVIGDDFARHIEDRLALPNGWMDTPQTGEPAGRWEAGLSTAHLRPIYNAPSITWGATMTKEIPQTFSVVLPDDAMAPRVRRGDVVRFQRDLTARPGDGVLVIDQMGRWFFREYRERRPGEWEAHPLNSGYQPMDSQRDGLTVAAVLTGIESQRWG